VFAAVVVVIGVVIVILAQAFSGGVVSYPSTCHFFFFLSHF
jgi:hypothetical protein